MGLVCRLTDQKGLDLVNAIIPQVMDENTQLNAMHYGTVPIVQETGGLKDTVEPYRICTKCNF